VRACVRACVPAKDARIQMNARNDERADEREAGEA
jgi:hypothetical protein